MANLMRLPSSHCALPLRRLPAVRKSVSCLAFLSSQLEVFTSSVTFPTILGAYVSSSRSSSWSPTMEAPPDGYRKNVGICLINSTNKIFAASRLDIRGAWQMPQGGIDNGEDPRTAAIRELREETGVISAEVLAEVPYWLTYDFPPQVKEKLNRLWGTNWQGQAQKWFLLRFIGNDEEINIAGDGTEAAEFSEWTWMQPQDVIDSAVEFKKPVYEEVFKYFAPHLEFSTSIEDANTVSFKS